MNQEEKKKLALKQTRQNYKTIRTSIFDYSYTGTEEEAVLHFKIECNKAVNNIALPTFLFFKKIPEEIPYKLIWGNKQRNGKIYCQNEEK